MYLHWIPVLKLLCCLRRVVIYDFYDKILGHKVKIFKREAQAVGMVERRRTATKVGVGQSFVLIALFPSFLLPSLSTLNKPPLAMPYKHTFQTDKKNPYEAPSLKFGIYLL